MLRGRAMRLCLCARYDASARDARAPRHCRYYSLRRARYAALMPLMIFERDGYCRLLGMRIKSAQDMIYDIFTADAYASAMLFHFFDI